jgi:hypothetical protein
MHHAYYRWYSVRLAYESGAELSETQRRSASKANADGDRQLLMTALTTEHFTLQGARSQTMSESAARASVFVFATSSALVALGFIAQVSSLDAVGVVFALAVLPTLYVLGAATFVRLVECSAEDFRYGLAINRIRHFYKETAGEHADLFLLSGHDDGTGVFENMGLSAERRSPLFAFSTAIAVIDGVVGGSAVGVALGPALGAPLGVAAGVGGAAAIASVLALLRQASRILNRAAQVQPLFPHPDSTA